MHHRFALAATLFLALAALACSLSGSPTPTAEPTDTQAANWSTYTNQAQGFSIDHPPEFVVPGADYTEPIGRLAEQIFFNVGPVSPLDCRGDCLVVEANSTVDIAGQSATKISGYIGAIGGNIPQQNLTYVFPRDGQFYAFTLYALASSATAASDDIQPLQADDVALFEQMLATLRFGE